MSGHRLIQGRMPFVLALAVATSFVELGPIALILKTRPDLVSVLLAGFAYQVGNAVPQLGGQTMRWPSLGLAVLAAAGMLSFPVATIPWLAALAVLSWALQVVRRGLTGSPGGDLPKTAEKRSARVFGFVAVTLVPITAWLPLVTIAVLASLRYPATSRFAPLDPQGGGGEAKNIRIAMVLHQAHYFSYCYAVPVLLISSSTGGVTASGLWFACGWISYLSAEALWRRFAPLPVFVAGHLFVTVVLVLLALASSAPWAGVVLWILTGFGGGTVYCLKLLHYRAGGAEAEIDRAEDIGHLLGIAVTLAGTALLHWDAKTLPLVGAAWAVAAGAIVFLRVWCAGRPKRRGRHCHAPD